jgi:hypothetical protein
MKHLVNNEMAWKSVNFGLHFLTYRPCAKMERHLFQPARARAINLNE